MNIFSDALALIYLEFQSLRQSLLIKRTLLEENGSLLIDVKKLVLSQQIGNDLWADYSFLKCEIDEEVEGFEIIEGEIDIEDSF